MSLGVYKCGLSCFILNSSGDKAVWGSIFMVGCIQPVDYWVRDYGCNAVGAFYHYVCRGQE